MEQHLNQAEIMASRSIQRDFRKPIWRKFLSAVRTYDLIQPGDHVAACISGGKDSLALAVCLRELAKYSDVPFKVSYLSMDPGYTQENRQRMIENAEKLGFQLNVFDSPIFEAVESVPRGACHVCASMRRGYLYKEAKKLGCNKIALGHHLDDAVETILLSLFYGGEYKTMMPKLRSKNFEGMELIRPLYLIRERDIIDWQNHMGLDTLRCACKVTRSEDGGKRKQVKDLLARLEAETPGVFGNIFHSIEHVNLQTVLGYQLRSDSPIISVACADEGMDE
ncbi:MAG: tRNA 2-thiocytidine biosynthesis protein TtcA [Clostridia bacterium]|nr:tRNA 2-thiocytidine biosynthesis protein TtcA [Clostridia bacterium]